MIPVPDQSMLEKAIHIATDAHQGQTDKGGRPYILHPLHVMLTVDTSGLDEIEAEWVRAVAVLHDVLEDTPREYGFEERIRMELGRPMVELLHALWKLPGESYRHYVKRAGEYVETRRVKLADLKHNMDLTRLGGAEPNLTRIGDYVWAYDYLLGLDID